MSRQVQMGLVAAVALLGLAPTANATVIEPTVFSDDVANNGNCTLREAVRAANLNAAVDECDAGSEEEIDRVFLDSGHYELDIPGAGEIDGLEGDLNTEINAGPLWIRGTGMNATFIDSEMDDRVLRVTGFADVSLLDLTATGNGYQDLTSAGVLELSSGEVELERVQVEGGDAQFAGGISCGQFCEVTITDSVIRDNQATVGSTGFPNISAAGGGISVSLGKATIKRTTIVGNEAIANDSIARGGGVAASGNVKILNSTIAGNATLSSSNSTAASSRRIGAGLFVEHDDTKVKVVNSTISQNNASSTGHASSGGGIYVEDLSKLTVKASTMGNNNASDGTAISAVAGRATIQGSVLDSFSANPNCDETGGSIKSKGYNVLGLDPGTCLGGAKSNTDLVADPLLGGIALDNGGPTATYALPTGSPAIDFVPKKKCRPAKQEDQRGTERPARKACDAGSYERTNCGGELVGANFTFGTPGKDNMSGLSGIDLLAPSAGADKFSSFDGNDVLCGGTGNDTLKGGNDDDALIGGKGKDDCDGGSGNDSGKSCEKEKSL